MPIPLYRLLIALIGLIAFLASLVVTVVLACTGHPIPAAWTGTGAIAAGTFGLFKLLTELSKS